MESELKKNMVWNCVFNTYNLDWLLLTKTLCLSFFCQAEIVLMRVGELSDVKLYLLQRVCRM